MWVEMSKKYFQTFSFQTKSFPLRKLKFALDSTIYQENQIRIIQLQRKHLNWFKEGSDVPWKRS